VQHTIAEENTDMQSPFDHVENDIDYEHNEDFDLPLYDNASISKGNFCLLMNKIKTDYNIPLGAMNKLYKLNQRILPTGNQAPTSSFQAKKMMTSLGLDYKLIHACPNHCMLYYDTKADLESCSECGESRYHSHPKKPRQVSIQVLSTFMEDELL